MGSPASVDDGAGKGLRADAGHSLRADAPHSLRADAPHSLRADARRNRDALLEAATAAFTERGVDTSLEDVARRAGVGIGTLYRHFPTRDALVEAAYRRGVENLCDAAGELLAETDPETALENWMLRFVGYVATKRGLAATLKLSGDAHTDLFTYVHERIRAAVDSMIKPAVAEGRLREDADGGDLIRALGGICMVSDQGAEQARRLVSLLMDGLRYGARARSGVAQ